MTVLTDAALFAILDDRVNNAPHVLPDGSVLTRISKIRDHDAEIGMKRRYPDWNGTMTSMLLTYADGSTRKIGTDYGDHGFTAFFRDGRPVAYAQITSDAAFDMRLMVDDEAAMARHGLETVTRLEDLSDDDLAQVASPSFHFLRARKAQQRVQEGRRPSYVHPAGRKPLDRAAASASAAASLAAALG